MSIMNRSRLAVAGLALVASLAIGAASAQQKTPVNDPARIAAAKEMFAVSGQAAQFDTVIATMTRGMGQMFKQQQPGHGKVIDEVMASMAAKFVARKTEMIDMVAPLFADKFTAAELNEISTFYRSPIGQKLVANQPEIMQRSMQLGMAWGQRIGQEVEAEFKRELKSRGVPI